MNPSSSLRFLARVRFAVAGFFVFAATLAAQTAATGTIEGRVFDARRGEYLEKARITIEGTTLETLTDDAGQYRLPNIPAGPAKVTVFYTGMGSQSHSVAITAGQVLQHDITFTGSGRATVSGEIVKLTEFVVSSSKEMDGAAIAINEQRFASNIMNVVSADEFGTIADGSIGEFMKFLPGITSDYTGGDARRFSINGVSAENVPISFGGFDMASAAGAGTGRQVELDQVSINSVSRIEVNMSPTPEGPGMALAGSVNFVPRSAFERSKPSFSYSVAMLLKDSEKHFHRTPGPRWRAQRKVNPGIDVSGVVPVNKNFGFSISAGYSLQYTPQDLSQMEWRGTGLATTVGSTATNGYPDTTPDNPYLTRYSVRDGNKNTTRYSLGTTIDYRFGPRDRIAVQLQYAYLHEAFANRTLAFIINRVSPGNWAPDHTWGQFGQGQIDMSVGGRLRPGRTFTPSLTWRHDGPTWKWEVGTAYSNSRIHYLDIDKGSSNTMTARRTGLTLLFDDIFYLRPNRITVMDAQLRPVDPYNLSTYSLVQFVSSQQKSYDTKKQAFANTTRRLDVLGTSLLVKSGVDMRVSERDMRGVGTAVYSFRGRDGAASTTGPAGDDGAQVALDRSFSQRVPPYGFPPIQWVNNELLWRLYETNPEYFVTNTNDHYRNATNASKFAQEMVSSAYVRGDIAFFHRRLKLTGGLRVEQTNIKANGPLIDPEQAFQRDANGQILRGANGRPLLIVPTNAGLPYSQLTLMDRGGKATKEYLRYFPSLNVSYDLTENFKVRAAYAQSIGRPNYNQYFGGVTLPDTEQLPSSSNRISVNNVGVKPWQAETYRLRLDYYFAGVGNVGVGVFQRHYDSFFETRVASVTPDFLAAYDLDPEEYGQFDVSTQYNNDRTVRMTGYEFEYKQALTPFLPHWARGVQVFFNTSGQRATGSDNFQDSGKFSANWGASFTRPKYNLRANYNYRGPQRRGAVAAGRSIQPGTYNYRSKRLYIDITGEYFFTRRFGLFAALRNVGTASEDDKLYGPSTPDYAKFRTRQDYHSLWTFGMKGTY